MACCILLATLIAAALSALSVFGKHNQNAAHQWRLISKDKYGKQQKTEE